MTFTSSVNFAICICGFDAIKKTIFSTQLFIENHAQLLPQKRSPTAAHMIITFDNKKSNANRKFFQ